MGASLVKEMRDGDQPSSVSEGLVDGAVSGALRHGAEVPCRRGCTALAERFRVPGGIGRQRAARGTDGNKVRSAYNTAMRAWQDEFHLAVASHFSLSRLGPARRRQDRKVYLVERKLELASAALTAAAVRRENAEIASSQSQMVLREVERQSQEVSAKVLAVQAREELAECKLAQAAAMLDRANRAIATISR